MKKIIVPVLVALVTIPAAANTEIKLAKPVQLKADGKLIDVGEDTSYAGPLVADVDEDGKKDLIVTSISGVFRWYRNVSDKKEPVYKHQGHWKIRGEPLRLKNW